MYFISYMCLPEMSSTALIRLSLKSLCRLNEIQAWCESVAISIVLQFKSGSCLSLGLERVLTQVDDFKIIANVGRGCYYDSELSVQCLLVMCCLGDSVLNRMVMTNH